MCISDDPLTAAYSGYQRRTGRRRPADPARACPASTAAAASSRASSSSSSASSRARARALEPEVMRFPPLLSREHYLQHRPHRELSRT